MIDNTGKKGFARIVGANLREARERKKYSQKDAAERININETQLSHFEAGRRVPSLMAFQKLCALYNVSPQEILGVNISRISGVLIHEFDLKAGSAPPDESESKLTQVALGYGYEAACNK